MKQKVKPTLNLLKVNQRVLKGFTLIELLVVIAILTILLAIVLVAINPQRQVQQANNTQRRSDVSAILNAVSQYAADNRGVLPTGITTSTLTIGSGGTGVDLCATLVPTYIADLPLDPTAGTKTPSTALCTAASAYNTGYTITLVSGTASGNRLTVAAPNAELAQTISITR